MGTHYCVKSLIIIILIFLSVRVYSQDDISAITVSLSFENIPLEEILEKISESGNINFSYNPKKIPLESQISIHVENESIKVVLEKICDQAHLSFEFVEQQIILKNKPKKKLNYTLSGYVKDIQSGELLIGAVIFLPHLNTGTITNAYGFYSLTVPAGIYDVEVSYIGYNQSIFQVELIENKTIDVDIKNSGKLLEEIIVSSVDRTKIFDVTPLSAIDLNPTILKEMPSLMGEGDVIKTIQAIPGIKLHGDGSTWFFVRGGGSDQNMILLDDAPIYNPSHMLGLFSTFVPDVVKNITIYKGDMPASYGGRLSSLVDIRTNDGNLNSFGFNGSIGLISSKLALETPIKKGKSSLFLSGRTSHIKWFFERTNPDVEDFYFYDLNAKLNVKLNKKNRLFLSFYSGADSYSNIAGQNTSSGIRWRNNALTFRWNHVFNNKVFSNTTISTSSYDYRMYTSIQQNNYWNAQIANLSLKFDLSWFLNSQNTIYTGINFSGHNMDPGNYYLDGKLGAQPYVSKKHARELALYAENEQKINHRFSLRYGFRLSIWDNTGESFEFVYNEDFQPIDTLYYDPGQSYHQYFNLEPRLSFNYIATKNTSLKLSYSRTTQYLHLISNSISPFTTLEVWLPSGPNIPDQTANQVILSWFQSFAKPGLDLSIEAYYKAMNNQIDYIDHANMLLNPIVESQLRYGKAKAYGIEFLIKKNEGKLTGWLGYTLSKVNRITKGINQDRTYPAFNDRPHELTSFLSFDFSKRFNASLNWYYATGAAFTTPNSFYYYNDMSLPIYSEKNNSRLPDYHRMDLSFIYRLNRKLRKYQHQLGLSIFNVYGRKNPIFINFNKIESENNSFVIPGNLLQSQDLLTTNTFVYNVIPSLTYYFQFK